MYAKSCMHLLYQASVNFLTPTFFQNVCEPKGYTPMLHKDHSDDLRHLRPNPGMADPNVVHLLCDFSGYESSSWKYYGAISVE